MCQNPLSDLVFCCEILINNVHGMGCREQSHLLPSQWGNSEVRLHTWWDFHAQVLCLGGGATDAMTTHHSPFHYMLCC